MAKNGIEFGASSECAHEGVERDQLTINALTGALQTRFDFPIFHFGFHLFHFLFLIWHFDFHFFHFDLPTFRFRPRNSCCGFPIWRCGNVIF